MLKKYIFRPLDKLILSTIYIIYKFFRKIKRFIYLFQNTHYFLEGDIVIRENLELIVLEHIVKITKNYIVIRIINHYHNPECPYKDTQLLEWSRLNYTGPLRNCVYSISHIEINRRKYTTIERLCKCPNAVLQEILFAVFMYRPELGLKNYVNDPPD